MYPEAVREQFSQADRVEAALERSPGRECHRPAVAAAGLLRGAAPAYRVPAGHVPAARGATSRGRPDGPYRDLGRPSHGLVRRGVALHESAHPRAGPARLEDLGGARERDQRPRLVRAAVLGDHRLAERRVFDRAVAPDPPRPAAAAVQLAEAAAPRARPAAAVHPAEAVSVAAKYPRVK